MEGASGRGRHATAPPYCAGSPKAADISMPSHTGPYAPHLHSMHTDWCPANSLRAVAGERPPQLCLRLLEADGRLTVSGTRKGMGSVIDELFTRLGEELVETWRRVYRDHLVTVAAFGSTRRGTPGPRAGFAGAPGHYGTQGLSLPPGRPHVRPPPQALPRCGHLDVVARGTGLAATKSLDLVGLPKASPGLILDRYRPPPRFSRADNRQVGRFTTRIRPQLGTWLPVWEMSWSLRNHLRAQGREDGHHEAKLEANLVSCGPTLRGSWSLRDQVSRAVGSPATM